MDDDNNASSLVDFASSLDEALGYSNDDDSAFGSSSGSGTDADEDDR